MESHFEMKHISRSEYHVIGIDPGKHNLIDAVDSENPKLKRCHIRYTLRERQKDMSTVRFEYDGKKDKPLLVQEGEKNLSEYNSRTVSLEKFKATIFHKAKNQSTFRLRKGGFID